MSKNFENSQKKKKKSVFFCFAKTKCVNSSVFYTYFGCNKVKYVETLLFMQSFLLNDLALSFHKLIIVAFPLWVH